MFRAPDLTATSMEWPLSEICLDGSWLCQNTLAWYVLNSANEELKQRFLEAVASGRQLGGTGLSNPMKSFFDRDAEVKGRRVDGGYVVARLLPWVSNLGPNHLFGTIFELEAHPSHGYGPVDCVARR